jgi:MFS family permease
MYARILQPSISHLTGLGNHYSIALFPRRGVPCANTHQALRLSSCTSDYDDDLGHSLFVTLSTIFPFLLILFSLAWAQAFITNRTSFYITRALIGACEGGFIPGVILFATYFYKSRELATRLAVFWSTLNVARVISALLAAGILNMRGVEGKPGWFWLFLLEGLLTFIIGLISFLYLPQSPVHTKSILCRHQWYSEREQTIMINRLLRDDPAKGLTAIKEPATLRDIRDAWGDKSMWGLYFLGLVAYIPATPVQGYLSLTLKRIGFSTFDSNMLSIPSAVLQIILMLALAKSSEFFNERTFHCFIGEFWCLPLLAALLALPSHGNAWGRFALTTMISGCAYPLPTVTARRLQHTDSHFQIHTSTRFSPLGFPKTLSALRNALLLPRPIM